MNRTSASVGCAGVAAVRFIKLSNSVSLQSIFTTGSAASGATLSNRGSTRICFSPVVLSLMILCPRFRSATAQ